MQKQFDVSVIVENCGTHATPLLYNGVLYVAEDSGHIRAILPTTGNEIWSYKTNGPVISSPTINDDVLYFGSLDNCIYALSIEGRMLWKFESGDKVASGPAVYEGKIYVGSSDNNLYALDKKTGRKIWGFRTGDEIIGDVLAHAGRIYFGSMDTYFYCLDLDGNLIWKFKTGDAMIIGRPVADGKKVYFGSTDETIYALSLNGEFVWGFKTGDALSNKPALKNNVVYCGCRDGRMYALNADTGICIWRFNTASGTPIGSAPLVTDNAVYFGSDKFYALNSDGFLLWSFHTNDYTISGPIAFNNKIIFACMDGHIRALSLNGAVAWVVLTKSSFKADLFGLLPPPKNNPAFFEERAKQLGIGVQEFAKKISDFNPYTFKPNSDIKTYLSSDAERYGGISESVGAYKDVRMGAVGMYSPAERKKKSVNDEILKEQVKHQFGI